MNLDSLRLETTRVLDESIEELVRAGHLEPGSLIVLGCSTSEITGARIGKGSVPELGIIVAQAFLSSCRVRDMHPVLQCCEHLNRALVMDKSVLQSHHYLQVCAVPQPKAGGSVAAAAWKLMQSPVLAQSVQADAAIDIGDTLVGMHLRPVAVPLRGDYAELGHAHLVMAYSRLPLIGGERAVYA